MSECPFLVWYLFFRKPFPKADLLHSYFVNKQKRFFARHGMPCGKFRSNFCYDFNIAGFYFVKRDRVFAALHFSSFFHNGKIFGGYPAEIFSPSSETSTFRPVVPKIASPVFNIVFTKTEDTSLGSSKSRVTFIFVP